MPTPENLCPRVTRFRGLKAEGGGDYRALHVNVESQIAAARLIIEVEAAVAELQLQPRVGGVFGRADDLPIAMRADPEPADIAIGRQAEAVAEIVVVASAQQRITPARTAVDALAGKETGVQRQIGREAPSAEPEAEIGELGRLVERAIEHEPGAHVGRQVRMAPLKEYIAGGDVGADRNVQYVAEEPERPLSDLERSHERGPVEMRQQINGAQQSNRNPSVPAATTITQSATLDEGIASATRKGLWWASRCLQLDVAMAAPSAA
jgi:hypothetical protein